MANNNDTRKNKPMTHSEAMRKISAGRSSMHRNHWRVALRYYNEVRESPSRAAQQFDVMRELGFLRDAIQKNPNGAKQMAADLEARRSATKVK